MVSLARRVATSSLCGSWAHEDFHFNFENLKMFSKIRNTIVPGPAVERVKFGVPLESICNSHSDLPGPLLVLILKLNKEAPHKKDVFRAPGHQAQMKKLIHFLQNGRLVNIDNYSVYTIASVLKKYLQKLPGGIFDAEREKELFKIIEIDDCQEKRKRIHEHISALNPYRQKLLVLLFGTFRAIANAADVSNMSAEALSISVAPSLFHSCVPGGIKEMARLEDVMRYKTASLITRFMIENFGVYNLFGHDNYLYYAKMSGRVLKVEENWIFAFKYPPDNVIARQASLMIEQEWLDSEAQRWGLPPIGVSTSLKDISEAHEHDPHSTFSDAHLRSQDDSQAFDRCQSSMDENLGDYYARMSMSLEEAYFKCMQQSPQNFMKELEHDPSLQAAAFEQILRSEILKLDDLKVVNQYAESTKSLTFLPIVHQRQTQRMKTRSEWFLNPRENASDSKSGPSGSTRSQTGSQSLSRKSSKEKRLIRRSSSKKDKENIENFKMAIKSDLKSGTGPIAASTPIKNLNVNDCTEVHIQQVKNTYTYNSTV